jgi:TetR/AcrR family transcriptional repressor of nem operon
MVGRPRQFDESEVLDAAMQAFWANGYEATSMADLLAVTGLHKGSLYQAFGDKHTLFVASLRRYLEGMRSKKNALLSAANSPLQGIRDVAHGMVDLACDSEPCRKGCMAINTLIEMAPHDEEINAVMNEHIGLMRTSLTARVVAAQQAGEVTSERDPEAVTLLIMTFMAGLATTLKGPLDRDQAHQLLDAQIDAVT